MEEERKAICGADEELEEALVALIAACVSHLEECEALKRLTALYLGGSLVNRDGEESDSDGNPRRKRSRIVSVRPDYSSSVWGKMLEDSSLADPTQSAKLFRRRLRVPDDLFAEIVSLAKDGKWFPSAETDVRGRRCIPLEMKECRVRP